MPPSNNPFYLDICRKLGCLSCGNCISSKADTFSLLYIVYLAPPSSVYIVKFLTTTVVAVPNPQAIGRNDLLQETCIHWGRPGKPPGSRPFLHVHFQANTEGFTIRHWRTLPQNNILSLLSDLDGFDITCTRFLSCFMMPVNHAWLCFVTPQVKEQHLQISQEATGIRHLVATLVFQDALVQTRNLAGQRGCSNKAGWN